MLSVVTLPGLMVVHSINVSSSAALCSGVMSEVCLYMCVYILCILTLLIGLHTVY